MRRRDREVSDRNQIRGILNDARVCRVAFSTGEAPYSPYIVPFSFGYRWDDQLEIFFHGAREGRKHDLMHRNPHVGFEIDVDDGLVQGPQACNWSMNYRSIIGTGVIGIIEDGGDGGHGAKNGDNMSNGGDGPEAGGAKARALDAIMEHYGFEGAPSYPAAMLARTAVMRLVVSEMSAKQRA